MAKMTKKITFCLDNRELYSVEYSPEIMTQVIDNGTYIRIKYEKEETIIYKHSIKYVRIVGVS